MELRILRRLALQGLQQLLELIEDGPLPERFTPHTPARRDAAGRATDSNTRRRYQVHMVRRLLLALVLPAGLLLAACADRPAPGSTTLPKVTTAPATSQSQPAPTQPAPTFSLPPISIPPSTQSETCTPGYSPCLPPASDYDCAGGSGNGPAYTGPVRVTGVDIYGLDADGDGYGCE